MPLLPKALAREGLSEFMKDPRYFDGSDPGHNDFVDFMRAGFEVAFNEDVDEDSGDVAEDVPVQSGRPRHSPREQQIIDHIRAMDQKARRGLLMGVILQGVAKSRGIGPDGPIDRRSGKAGIDAPESRSDVRPNQNRMKLEDVVGFTNERAMKEAEAIERQRILKKQPSKKKRPTVRTGPLRLPPISGGGPGFRPRKLGGRRLLPSFLDILD